MIIFLNKILKPDLPFQFYFLTKEFRILSFSAQYQQGKLCDPFGIFSGRYSVYMGKNDSEPNKRTVA